MKRFLALFAGLTLLAGCASMPAPETNSQRLAYAEAQVAALANSAATLHETGVLSDRQRDNVADRLETVDRSLDAAWIALRDGNLDTVNDTLITVNRLLLSVRSELQEAQEDG